MRRRRISPGFPQSSIPGKLVSLVCIVIVWGFLGLLLLSAFKQVVKYE